MVIFLYLGLFFDLLWLIKCSRSDDVVIMNFSFVGFVFIFLESLLLCEEIWVSFFEDEWVGGERCLVDI